MFYPVLLASGYYMWKETEDYHMSGFYYSDLITLLGNGFKKDYWRPYGFFHTRADDKSTN